MTLPDEESGEMAEMTEAEAAASTVCPICMEEGATVTLCPRTENPCAARYHEECAELHRKHGGEGGAQCPTCRAMLPARPAWPEERPARPARAVRPARPQYLFFSDYPTDCAGFVLFYAMTLVILLAMYIASGLFVCAVIRVLYGQPEGVELQRHRVYFNGTASSFDVRLDDVELDERRWAKTARRLHADGTTRVRAMRAQTNLRYELHGKAEVFYKPMHKHSAKIVDYVRIKVNPPHPVEFEVLSIVETPWYSTDPSSAAFFDHALVGFVCGGLLYGWRRLLVKWYDEED